MEKLYNINKDIVSNCDNRVEQIYFKALTILDEFRNASGNMGVRCVKNGFNICGEYWDHSKFRYPGVMISNSKTGFIYYIWKPIVCFPIYGQEQLYIENCNEHSNRLEREDEQPWQQKFEELYQQALENQKLTVSLEHGSKTITK